MPCTVCEHCQAPVQRHENLAMLNGFSYHETCRKCYVCSETNLQNAEVFKGVIFCNSCSQRIFQGCSTARKTKESSRKTRDRLRKRRSYRTKGSKRQSHNRILEMAGQQASTGSSKSCSDNKGSQHSKSTVLPTELVLTKGKPVFEDIVRKRSKSIKKDSAEIGMTTEVTQELLKEMHCPVVYDKKKPAKQVRSAPKPERKRKTRCSDLRIAELGASTEIANMALRHRSEQPVIIKSDNHMEPSESRSNLRDSAVSGDRNEKWFDSAYSSLQASAKTCVLRKLMDRRMGSLLKLPYVAFRRNVLTRSSLINVLMSSEDKESLLQKIKLLFNEDITNHQRRGLKRLYSTINRKKTPNKMGWLNLVANINAPLAYKSRYRSGHRYKSCKHFKASHSYRCMRAQIMKLAGPTKSELAEIRAKMKNMIAPGFLRAMAGPRYPAIKMSEACGTSKPSSTVKSYTTKLSVSNAITVQ